RSEQVESVLSRACVALIEDRVEAVQHKAQAIRELLDTAFERMQAHVDGLVTEALGGCAAPCGQVVEDAATLGASLESGLLDLETAVGTAASALDSAHLPARLP